MIQLITVVENYKRNAVLIESMDQRNEAPHIVFEGEEMQRIARPFRPTVPKTVQWIIRYSGGLIKDERQANYVLIGFVLLAIIVSALLILGSSSESQPPFNGGSNPYVV